MHSRSSNRYRRRITFQIRFGTSLSVSPSSKDSPIGGILADSDEVPRLSDDILIQPGFLAHREMGRKVYYLRNILSGIAHLSSGSSTGEPSPEYKANGIVPGIRSGLLPFSATAAFSFSRVTAACGRTRRQFPQGPGENASAFPDRVRPGFLSETAAEVASAESSTDVAAMTHHGPCPTQFGTAGTDSRGRGKRRKRNSRAKPHE